MSRFPVKPEALAIHSNSDSLGSIRRWSGPLVGSDHRRLSFWGSSLRWRWVELGQFAAREFTNSEMMISDAEIEVAMQAQFAMARSRG